MHDSKYEPRSFLQKLANIKAKEEQDPLFKKYARKEGSGRRYSSYQRYLDKVDHPDEQQGTAERVGNVTSGLAPYTGGWTEWEVIHLLKRTSFGNRKTDIAALSAMTTSAAVDTLTTINTTPTLPSSTPLNFYQSVVADPNIALGADWTTNNLNYSAATATNDVSVNSNRNLSHNCWTWGLWLNEAPSIREKMVNFWYHFIPVNYSEVANLVNNSATLQHDYIKLLRTNALGNF